MTNKTNNNERKLYKYEIHLHTAETSRCGYLTAEELVSMYKELGYDGICITDHLHDFYLSLMDCRGDWQRSMDRFMFGYHEAKKAGEAAGLDVIFGIELRFTNNDSDFLVFGVDEEWLRANPFVCHMRHEEFFRQYGDSVLMLQAHPFRNGHPILIDYIHGLEVVNGNPRQKNRNEDALALALANPRLLTVCGSDMHQRGDQGQAALLFPHRIRDSYEMKAAIESRDYRLWCPGSEEIIAQVGGQL